MDLLEREEFINKCIEQVNIIASECKNITAIVGAPSLNPNDKGKNLFNTAYVLSEGKIIGKQNKTLLPNYDVFDEYRYFQPNDTFSVFNVCGKKIAISICEDLWDDQPVANSFAKSKLYSATPIDELKSLNPDLLINIAASPFSSSQGKIRENIIKSKAKYSSLPIIYVNQVGANTELIFDGGSIAVNNKGEIVKNLQLFNEDLQYCTLNELNNNSDLKVINTIPEKMELINKALVLGIKDYFNKSGFTKATLGLSGGIDSAVTLVLAAEALGPENIRVLLLPSKYSSEHSIKDAEDLANNLNIKYDIIPINEVVDSVDSAMKTIFKGLEPDVTEENIQARIRGTLLMALSNKFGNILLNTSNKSECAVGYGTLYGDMNGGLSVLGDIYKTEVFELAKYINRNKEIIPVNTIVKPPSAELRPEQKDSDSLPDYNILDKILFYYIEKNISPKKIIDLGYNEHIVNKTVKMVNRNEYKRFQTAPILRVSSKAFGMGRKIPIVSYL